MFYGRSTKGICNNGKPKKISFSITDEYGETIVVRKDIDVTDGMKEIQRIESRKKNMRRQNSNPFASMNKDVKTLFGGSK